MAEVHKKPKIIALLVAAGKSERMGAETPKPYLKIGGESILRRTAKVFLSHPEIYGVKIVIRREHHGIYRKETGDLTLIPYVVGGNSRSESVFKGLESIYFRDADYVLIHDIARPFVSHALISRVIEGLKSEKAVIPVIPVTDTVKTVKNNEVIETLPRAELFNVQTPQGFDYGAIVEAHRKMQGKEFTDDATVCEAAGIKVATVAGEQGNIKITHPEDITMEQETRIGSGFDVHRLEKFSEDIADEQKFVKICGVQIPSDYYLLGHSDADVGLHAMTDAILGAIAEGDIGTHFPPSDEKWKGAESEKFLLHAYELMKSKGGKLVNIDVTIICERPKITPHREAMRKHIAELLAVEEHRISIKATTTERLGFTGRGEGIAAQAVVSIAIGHLY